MLYASPHPEIQPTMGQAVEIDILEVHKVNKYYMLIFDLKSFIPFENGVKLPKFWHGIKF